MDIQFNVFKGNSTVYWHDPINIKSTSQDKRHLVRDRPFNLKGGVMVFCFVQKMFFGQHKS